MSLPPLAVLRMIDANHNRAAEALRTMEDLSRFVLQNRTFCAQLKSARHDLHAALARLPIPAGTLTASRDTAGDVGASISTPAELTRADVPALAAAAGARATQALRVLEECAKTLDPSVAQAIQALRYHLYTLDQSLQAALGSSRSAAFRLCLILTSELCARPWQQVVQAFGSAFVLSNPPAHREHSAQASDGVRATSGQGRGAGGIERGFGTGIEGGYEGVYEGGCIQVREKSMNDAALLAHVRHVIDLAAPFNIPVIVNDRPDIAVLSGAAGVHLGAGDLPIREVRKLAGTSLIIGASTHNLEEARRAVSAGADYCGVGAMFQTPLKPDRVPSGVAYLREFIASFPATPYLAIGGLTPDRIRDLRTTVTQAPAAALAPTPPFGCAVSSAICAADDPAAVTRDCLAALFAPVHMPV